MTKQTATAQARHEEAHAITARDVQFDWDGMPFHYVPNEPVVTQVWNFMHLVLPEAERAMAGALADALPYIEDERLREEAVGFIGQEAMHASSHEGVRAYLTEHGLDVEPMVDTINYLIDKVLTDHGLSGRAKKAWLKERLGLFAALEHFTAIIGQWLLEADELDKAGIHPMMLDLLRWHGAEEVEHRSVVFDVYHHVDGSYARRARTALLASTTLAVLTFASITYLVNHDPSPNRGKPWPVQFVSAAMRGLVPSGLHFLTEIPVYLKPGFHPSSMGSLDQALRYLATSPAANAELRQESS
ncbi:metal-dependent hydrolase [Antrihabitans stalagmiti]|uniref:metal-dependent hydrolase n=1 Tax=Antrihabitans stalagmiti TaxID=2799499 RepID=UPI001F1E4C2D|nr:metal-dependent hydrolase [Antrihabitans stalagmiti]